MTVDMSKLNALDALAYISSEAINGVNTLATDAFKSSKVEGNIVKFYTDKTPVVDAIPAFSIDFPSKMVLDQAKTTFAPNFTFSTETYSGATAPDPNIDGKPVLVLAVKTIDVQNNATIKYSFLNLAKLIDVYKIKAGDSAKFSKSKTMRSSSLFLRPTATSSELLKTVSMQPPELKVQFNAILQSSTQTVHRLTAVLLLILRQAANNQSILTI